MTDFYLSSVDGNDGTPANVTWWNGSQSTYATLEGVLGAMSAGDRVYVDDNHSNIKNTSTKNLASPGTAASPCEILCVDRSTGALSTGAVEGTDNQHIGFSGYAYAYGLDIQCDRFLQWASISPWWWKLDTCSLAVLENNASWTISVGTTGGNADDWFLELENCDVSFAHAGQGFSLRSRLSWRGGTLGGTATTALFQFNPGVSGSVLAHGVDLSNLGSGHSIVESTDTIDGKVVCINCKLGPSVALTSGSVASQGSVESEFVNCDSADTNYKYYKQTYQGEIFDETTIVRTGGASDGVTGLSHRFVSTANSKFYSPLVGPWIPVADACHQSGSAITLTAEVVTDNVTLTDAEAWIEVEYLGTSGFPISTSVSDRAADILASGSSQPTSSETWTTTGLTTPVKQSLSVTFTPQEKGIVRARVCLAKASTTMYVCPKITVS